MAMSGMSGMGGFTPPTQQTDAYINQAAPVQNTWYTILATTANVILYSCAVDVETANETLEIEWLVDGITWLHGGIVAVAGSWYPVYKSPIGTTSYLENAAAGDTVTGAMMGKIPLFCKSLRVRVRKVTAAGAGNLRGRVVYGTW